MGAVKREEAQEVRCRAGLGDRPAFRPVNGRCVVGESRKRELAYGGDLGKDVLVRNNAGQFQVGVVHSACGVFPDDKAALEVLWERLSPHEWRRGTMLVGTGGRRWYPNTTHAYACRVTRTNVGGLREDDLCDASWTFAQATSEKLEVGELVMHGRGKLDAFLVTKAESLLEGDKHSGATRNSKHHASELSNELVPRFDRDAAAATKSVKEFFDAGFAMWWQFDCALNGIEHPAQNGFQGCPAGVFL